MIGGMENPNPRALIERLIATGWNQTEIAEALNRNGVSVSQPHVNRIKQGHTRSTSFEIGMGLLHLVRTRAKPPRRSALNA